jgi:hypothetical protein
VESNEEVFALGVKKVSEQFDKSLDKNIKCIKYFTKKIIFFWFIKMLLHLYFYFLLSLSFTNFNVLKFVIN